MPYVFSLQIVWSCVRVCCRQSLLHRILGIKSGCLYFKQILSIVYICVLYDWIEPLRLYPVLVYLSSKAYLQELLTACERDCFVYIMACWCKNKYTATYGLVWGKQSCPGPIVDIASLCWQGAKGMQTQLCCRL